MFHEYLYGSTFDVYTDNNPLTYILTTAKLDTLVLGCQLGKLQFPVVLPSWKDKHRCRCLIKGVLARMHAWELRYYLRVTAAVVQAVQEASLEGPASSIVAYSCNLHVLDPVQDSQQVACMTLEDWCQAQQVDPTLSLVISALWDGTLEQWQSKLTNLPEFSLFLWEWNHLLLKQGILYRWTRPRELEETLFQLVFPATQREVALKGCHDQVGHLGLECMLILMHDWFLLPCMAAQAKEQIRKCHPCLAFEAKQPKAPLENIMATHPLELVHLDYLCLEPGKGLEENVLVVTDHFTRYTQAYVIRIQTAQTTAKTLWGKFIVFYGLPKKILLDQGQNFKSQWLTSVCRWECRRYRPAIPSTDQWPVWEVQLHSD